MTASNIIKFPSKLSREKNSEPKAKEVRKFKKNITDDLRNQMREERRSKHGFSK